MASKYQFSLAQRFAVYTTHGGKYYLCRRPLDLETMEVDHVIPESLLADPARLAAVLKALGRPGGFDINSFANWMPACRPCNGRKLDSVFEPTPVVQLVLQQAAQKAGEAEELATEEVTRERVARALNVLRRAAETGAAPLPDDAGTTPRGGGPVDPLTSQAGLQALIHRLFPPAEAAGAPSGAGPADSALSLELTLRDGRDQVDRIRKLLDEWEFDQAYVAAEQFAAWLSGREPKLPRPFLAGACTLLAEVEVVRAKAARLEGRPPDLSRARYLLDRARNVGR